MRTQKFSQIKALVAKYKNLVDNSEAVKSANEKASIGNPYWELRYAELTGYEEQLLAHFYPLAAKETADSYILKDLGLSVNYMAGLLTADEENFLVDNFDFLVEYLFENGREKFISSAEAPKYWSRVIKHLLKGSSQGLKVLLPCSHAGDELKNFQDCSFWVNTGYGYAALSALSSTNVVNRYEKNKDISKGYFGDCFEKESFDVFISETPKHVVQTSKEELLAFLKGSYDLVRKGGELFICFSRKELFAESTKDFRQMMIEKQELAEAIELPNGKILLHIVKNLQNTFVMTDATAFVGHIFKSEVLDVDQFIASRFCNNHCEGKAISSSFDYSLLSEVFIPSYYLNRCDGKCLGSFVDTPKKTYITDECDAKEKVVTENNLSYTFSSGEISFDKLKTVDMSRARLYWRVSGPCVIFVATEKVIAVAYKLDDKSVLVPKHLHVLQPKNAEETQYLAALLLSKETGDQIRSLVIGNDVYSSIFEHWLEYVKIQSSSKEEQFEFEGKVRRIDWQKQEQAMQVATVRYKQNVRLHKHALSQNISAFDSLFRTLKRSFDSQGGRLKKSDRISTVSDMTAEMAFENLLGKITVIRERVDHIAEDQNWGICESIDPQKFVEEFESKHIGGNFKFFNEWREWKWFYKSNYFEEDVVDKETGKIIFHKGDVFKTAWFPKAALTQVLENIVSNAQSHGFVVPSRNDYKIAFHWETDGLDMVLYVKNNGTPIPEDMSVDKILQYGYSSSLNTNGHGGIGCGQIAEIMQEFCGSVEVVSTPSEFYTVTYKLTMPLSSLY